MRGTSLGGNISRIWKCGKNEPDMDGRVRMTAERLQKRRRDALCKEGELKAENIPWVTQRRLVDRAIKHLRASLRVPLDQFAVVAALEELLDQRASLTFVEIPSGHLLSSTSRNGHVD